MVDCPEPLGAAASTTERDRGEADEGARLAMKEGKLLRVGAGDPITRVLTPRLMTTTACDGRTALQVAVEALFIANDILEA